MAPHRFTHKTNERLCGFFFCFFTLHSKKKTFVRFLGESTACKSAYGFIWPLGTSRILVRTSLCCTHNLPAWLEQADLICQKMVRLVLMPLYVLEALPCLWCQKPKYFTDDFEKYLILSTFRKHLKSLTKDIKCVFIRVYVALELFCYWIFCYIFVFCFRNKQKAKSKKL